MTQVLRSLKSRWVNSHLRSYSTTNTSKKWKNVVGLEIHAQLASDSKLFSGARNSFTEPINSSVALLDASIPGTLPFLDRRCVEMGIKTALALSCKINEVSMFDRKHYFYADLPDGSTGHWPLAPLASNGSLTFPVFTPGVIKEPYYKTVRLHQLQELGISLIDLNRAGVPLMELVIDPDLVDGEEAASLVKELVLIFSALETCNCRMEEGSLRVDANISIHKENEPLGTRTEVKNIFSIRAVANAVKYEIERQIMVKDNGGTITNDTRSWVAITKTTIPMRDKEVVQDYRFMPEPNLPPLHLNLKQETSDELINVCVIEKTLPVLPQQLREKLMTEQQLSHETAEILVNDNFLLQHFNIITEADPERSPKTVANFLINELLKFLNKNKIDVENCKISSDQIGGLIDMLKTQVINLNLAQSILDEMMDSTKSPMEIADEKNLKQITDDTEILKICEEVLATDSGVKLAKAYKSGKTKVLTAVAREIDQKTDSRINMGKVVTVLKDLMSK